MVDKVANLKQVLITTAAGLCVLSTSASSITLKEVVKEVLETNPVVQERLRNYRATRSEIGIAEAGYYPSLDLQIAVGKESKGRYSNDVTEQSFDIFQNSLVMRQNIFSGFSTHERVNYQMMRTLAAAYSYLEKANDVTLQTIKVYVDLLRQRELLRNARTHVNHIQKLYDKVTKAYKAGLTKMSEVSKVRSSLSLAKSNLLVQRNRLENAMYGFRRIVGRTISLNELRPVRFNTKLPRDQEKASMYALEYNPSVLVGKYNIKGAEALYRESKSKYFPKLDFEMRANYNDSFSHRNIYTDREDDFRAMLVVSYNLLNGGADEAARLSKLSKLGQEVSVVNDLKRQVMEGMDLSWSTYELSRDQIPVLKKYRDQSEETLKLYFKEYDMGERSLLDLLATENDLKRANDELINARYSMLIAKYRIIDAMGLTMASIVGDVQKYYKKVGLHNNGVPNGKDTLPFSRDEDNDRISSSKDLCENSPKSKNGKKASGCRRSINALKILRGRK